MPFFGQLAWTAQQVYGVPYLTSLGVPEGQIPIFVLSGPLAGLVAPPLIAALSNICQSRWGKRKPFIFVGGIGTITSFLFLAGAESIALYITSPYKAKQASHIIAGLSIYALNFSIQPLQLGLRASVVDHFESHEQPVANLYISGFSSLGSVFVAIVGLGYNPPFWDLVVVVVATLGLLLCFSALVTPLKVELEQIREASPQRSNRSLSTSVVSISLRSRASQLVRKLCYLPPVTKRTCVVQLVSWFAWFLVLNYTSALVSRTYSGLPTTSDNVISRVAVLFYSTALATLAAASIVRWLSREKARHKADHLTNHKFKHHHGNGQLTRTQHILIWWLWKPCLIALATFLSITCVVIIVFPKPSPHAANAISILLGVNGMFFAMANWVPYALIADEASTRARAFAMIAVEGDNIDDKDDTPRLLAVHNMAITAPQIVASIASYLLMQGMAVLGLEQHVVWVFVMCIPFAIWAACL
ncbi:hypothetical protein DL98DRAFT_596418 [Cadophora sp. DSE1049]|nr:hypothetical protein DL98DRAFT_596418 [Cadophora sp. DSE1049]